VALSRLRAGHDGRAVQRAVDALQEASRPPHSAGTLHQSGQYFRSAQCPLLGNLSTVRAL